jgi:hypothetical protein
VPPWFGLPKSFYKKLAEYAAEFGMTRQQLLIKAIPHYAQALRDRNAPLAKALGKPEITQRFKQMVSQASKNWWANVSPEEKKARAQRANAARWKKAQAKDAGGASK